MMKALCFVLLLVCAHAASITVDELNNVDVGTWSTWHFIRVYEVPNFTTTLTITAVNSSVQIQNSQISLTANPPVLTASFRYKPSATGIFSLNYQVDTTLQFSVTSGDSFYSRFRNVYFEGVQNTKIGMPSEPIQIYLDNPSTSDLTLTPAHSLLDSSRITFQPTSITIPAGSLTSSFTYTGKDEIASVTFNWTLTGNEAALYNPPSDSGSFSVTKRTILRPGLSSYVLANKATNQLSFYVPERVNGSITVTPVAADTTFTPASVDLTGTTQIAQFSYISSSLQSSRPVYYYLSGDAASTYTVLASSSTSIPIKEYMVDVPYQYVLNKKSKISIRLYAPASGQLTFSLFATSLKFNPATVTFSGATTSISVDVTPTNLGTDVISFTTSGTDADFYTPANNYEWTVYVNEEYTFGIGDYTPRLYVGQESDPIPIWITNPPSSKITVTPTAPFMTFKPATLTFDKNTRRQTFTITPLPTSATSSTPVTVRYLVSGDDAPVYDATVSTQSFTVQKRDFQFVWSSDFDGTAYLGKSNYVWATANYIAPGESVTVTPVNPHMTFEPAQLKFSSGTTHIKFKAVANAVVGSTIINYIIEGNAGGYFADSYSDNIDTAMRPLVITSAALGIDERSPWYYNEVVDPTQALLRDNHVKSFVFATDVIPDDKLVIEPKSPHFDFEPSSIALTSADTRAYYAYDDELDSVPVGYDYSSVTVYYYVQANFTVKAKSSGSHWVTFELSGSDANYYTNPPHVQLGAKLYTDNGKKPSSATGVMASMVFVVLMALALVL
jgi:hypothetical protein